jgi:hypothetical protein
MRIRRLVEEVDEQHREAMRTIVDDLGEVHFGAGTRASRRRFMRTLGLGGAVAVGAAVVPMTAMAGAAGALGGQDEGGEESGGGESDLPAGDLAIVEFAQGVEFAAVAAYELAVSQQLLSAQETELARTFGRHHAEHGTALGTLAGQASDELDRSPNQALVDAVAPQLQAAAAAPDLLQVLFTVEQGAAATYLTALGALESPTAAGPAASIVPIEAQHATALGTVLDLPIEEWMPAFQPTAGAFDPAEYAG